MSDRDDRAGGPLRVPPPVYYAAALAAAWGVGRLFPRPLPEAFSFGARLGSGFGLIAVGAAAALGAVRDFRRAGTTVHPYRDADRLVTSGPYRLSRNPMYVGLTAVSLGMAILLDSWWMVGGVFAACALVDRRVIVPEERRLEARFGEAYRDFKRRTRRWL